MKRLLIALLMLGVLSCAERRDPDGVSGAARVPPRPGHDGRVARFLQRGVGPRTDSGPALPDLRHVRAGGLRHRQNPEPAPEFGSSGLRGVGARSRRGPVPSRGPLPRREDARRAREPLLGPFKVSLRGNPEIRLDPEVRRSGRSAGRGLGLGGALPEGRSLGRPVSRAGGPGISRCGYGRSGSCLGRSAIRVNHMTVTCVPRRMDDVPK